MRDRPSGMSVYEQYAVNFIRSSPQIGNETGAYHCGSGTLVNMGGVHGILTAGHVLKELGRDEQFVMISGTGPTNRGHSRKVTIEPGSMLINWSGEKSRLGPDIGFVRLPNEIRDWALQNLAFYNYGVRYKLYDEGQRPAPTDQYYVFGAMNEGSEIKSSGNGRNSVTTNFGFFTGELLGEDDALEQAGSFIFLPSDSAANPDDFKGLSGSGVWAVNEKDGPLGRVLIGVIYFQYEAIRRGVRPLVFHSVEWAYDWLYAAVSQRFAGEFRDFT